jgi:hypothetical protein
MPSPARKDPFDPARYATNEQFTAYFAQRGIAVENVSIDAVAHRRRFNVAGLPPMSLDMDASASECLRTVKEFIREQKKETRR